MPLGRRVMFDNKDVGAIRALPESDKVTGRFYIGGSRFNPNCDSGEWLDFGQQPTADCGGWYSD